MSFSFGFTADNFSDDELVETEFTGTNLNVNKAQEMANNTNPLDVIDSVQDINKRAPKFENFNELVQSLKDVRITFEKYITPNGNVVYRRELYDVKHQLMHEDNGEDDSNNDEFNILIGDNSTDLKKNVYEGGLKSWECSIDTVDKLSLLNDEVLFSGESIVELGCGTSLPSTYLFNRLLKSGISQKSFVLSDYNSSVLRLVTIPNLIVTWASNLSLEESKALQLSEDGELPIVEDELQLTQGLLTRFLHHLEAQKISIYLLSGSWGRQFVNLLKSLNSHFKFIITSETIYSPETLPIIGEILIELITESKSNGYNTVGIVSAKDIYFGVGGSVVEFESFLSDRQKNGANIDFRTEKIRAGLNRSIVFIE